MARIVFLASLALCVSCGVKSSSVGAFTGSGDEGIDAGDEAADDDGASSAGTTSTGADTETTGTEATETETETETESDESDEADAVTGPLLDTDPPDTGETSTAESCSFVDLLFVIDNSVSMGGYQNALALAFPQFADTLVNALEPGTNVHVAVTSTEMGYSSSGSVSISNGVCEFTGDGMLPNTAFYVTPDVMDTGRNGAQGRLYDPGSGQRYFEIDTDAGQASVDALAAWFAEAATIGTGGSQVEMSAGPAGWAVDPANDATNAGFLRDEGAVLVVFFMQDEPDQTPGMIDGGPGGQAILDQIALAKAGCGGLECVVAGGFLNAQACSAQGNLPLDDLLAGVGSAPAVQPLPNENLADDNPEMAAAEMNALLNDTLAAVIVEKCDEIPPVD